MYCEMNACNVPKLTIALDTKGKVTFFPYVLYKRNAETKYKIIKVRDASFYKYSRYCGHFRFYQVIYDLFQSPLQWLNSIIVGLNR